MSSFSQVWGEGTLPGLSFSDKLKLLIRGKNAKLREKLTTAIRKLEKCLRALNTDIHRFDSLRNKLFQMAKEALKEGDETQARALSNEIALLDKVKGILVLLYTCLHRILTRLRLVLHMGDTVHDLGPALILMKKIAPVVASVMPSIKNEVYEVQDVLERLCDNIEGFTNDVAPVDYETSEAEAIYEAIKLSVEKDAELAFPELTGQGIGVRKGVRSLDRA